MRTFPDCHFSEKTFLKSKKVVSTKKFSNYIKRMEKHSRNVWSGKVSGQENIGSRNFSLEELCRYPIVSTNRYSIHFILICNIKKSRFYPFPSGFSSGGHLASKQKCDKVIPLWFLHTSYPTSHRLPLWYPNDCLLATGNISSTSSWSATYNR